MRINSLDRCVFVHACACQKCDFRLNQEVSYSHGLEGEGALWASGRNAPLEIKSKL